VSDDFDRRLGKAIERAFDRAEPSASMRTRVDILSGRPRYDTLVRALGVAAALVFVIAAVATTQVQDSSNTVVADGGRTTSTVDADTEASTTTVAAAASAVTSTTRPRGSAPTIPSLPRPRVPGADAPGFPGFNRIAFARRNGTESQLYSMKDDGSDLKTFDLPGASRDDGPAWSPDGRTLAFSRAYSGTVYELRLVLHAADGSRRDLTSGAQDKFPAWSTDGRQIVFDRFQTGVGSSIMVINADGSGPRTVTSTSSGLFGRSSFSPDGTKILFWSSKDSFGPGARAGDMDVYVVSVDGSGLTRLTNAVTTGGFNGDPAWSPDGTRIVFSSSRDDAQNHTTDLYLMNADGSQQRRVVHRSDSENGPCWSGDGSRLFFSAGPDGSRAIWSSTVDGTDARRLTDANPSDDQPACGPSRN
jgi:Tol biopolymer transport system component